MHWRVVLHPDATAEARAARQWYAERNPIAAAAFLTELDAAVERVARAPKEFPAHSGGTYFCLFRTFPFALRFVVESDEVVILAVAHTRRRPGYWRTRG